MKYLKLIFVFFVTITFFSCQRKIEEAQEYLQWINDAEHELIRQKEVGDLILKVKYLPADLLAWKELKDKEFTAQEKDSLVQFYQHSLSFLLSVSPDSSKGAHDDILYRGVSNEQDFKLRVNQFNFGIERMLKLQVNNQEYYPALAVMENTYGTSLSKNFYVVFNADDKKRIGDDWERMDLVFSDELFSTGINHFIFSKEAFNTIPVFSFRSHKTK